MNQVFFSEAKSFLLVLGFSETCLRLLAWIPVVGRNRSLRICGCADVCLCHLNKHLKLSDPSVDSYFEKEAQ